MHTILRFGLGLAVLGGTAFAQSPQLATSRIVDVAPPLNPVPIYRAPEVERFDRERALQERRVASVSGRHFPVQQVSAAQPAVSAQTAAQIAPSRLPTAAIESATKPPAPRHWRRLLIHEQCVSARDMVPHYAYQAPYGGAYYFRPYMAEHIGHQAELAGSWQADRNNPYDNRFLQAIYGPAGN